MFFIRDILVHQANLPVTSDITLQASLHGGMIRALQGDKTFNISDHFFLGLTVRIAYLMDQRFRWASQLERLWATRCRAQFRWLSPGWLHVLGLWSSPLHTSPLPARQGWLWRLVRDPHLCNCRQCRQLWPHWRSSEGSGPGFKLYLLISLIPFLSCRYGLAINFMHIYLIFITQINIFVPRQSLRYVRFNRTLSAL